MDHPISANLPFLFLSTPPLPPRGREKKGQSKTDPSCIAKWGGGGGGSLPFHPCLSIPALGIPSLHSFYVRMAESVFSFIFRASHHASFLRCFWWESASRESCPSAVWEQPTEKGGFKETLGTGDDGGGRSRVPKYGAGRRKRGAFSSPPLHLLWRRKAKGRSRKI